MIESQQNNIVIIIIIIITSFCLSYLRRSRRRSRPVGSPGRRTVAARWWPGQSAVLVVCRTERASVRRTRTADRRRTLAVGRLVGTVRTPP